MKAFALPPTAYRTTVVCISYHRYRRFHVQLLLFYTSFRRLLTLCLADENGDKVKRRHPTRASNLTRAGSEISYAIVYSAVENRGEIAPALTASGNQ